MIENSAIQPADLQHSKSQPLKSLQFAIWTCSGLLTLYAVYFARTLVVPFLFAFFMYLTFRPILRRLRRIGIPSAAGAFAVLLVLGLLVIIGGYCVYSPTQELLVSLPQSIEFARSELSFITDRIAAFNDATAELSDIAEASSDDMTMQEPVAVEIKQPAWTSNLTLLNGTGNGNTA